jgi:hypothetical protein
MLVPYMGDQFADGYPGIRIMVMMPGYFNISNSERYARRRKFGIHNRGKVLIGCVTLSDKMCLYHMTHLTGLTIFICSYKSKTINRNLLK